MNERQQNLRYTAARDFMESLDKLQETLQVGDAQPVQPSTPSANANQSRVNTSPSDPFDLSSFEQAVADIEAYIQTQNEQTQKGEDGHS